MPRGTVTRGARRSSLTVAGAAPGLSMIRTGFPFHPSRPLAGLELGHLTTDRSLNHRTYGDNTG